MNQGFLAILARPVQVDPELRREWRLYLEAGRTEQLAHAALMITNHIKQPKLYARLERIHGRAVAREKRRMHTLFHGTRRAA